MTVPESTARSTQSATNRTIRTMREHAVNITLATTKGSRPLARTGAGIVAGLAAVGGLALASTAAHASTLGGTATIAQPGTTTALPSGGSTTQFTLNLPNQASCTGDTATGGYHVYSYLIQQGTALSGITFINFPSAGYGLVDTAGTYYGPANTAVTTGQIIGIPNDFEWGPLVSTDGGSVSLAQLLYTGGTTGVWEAGLVCTDTHGVVSDNWNTEVTFTASSTDAHGFTWSAVPGSTTPTTTTTTSTPATTTTTTSDVNATTTTTTSDPNATTTTTTTTAGGGGGGGGTSTPSDVAASSTDAGSTGSTRPVGPWPTPASTPSRASASACWPSGSASCCSVGATAGRSDLHARPRSSPDGPDPVRARPGAAPGPRAAPRGDHRGRSSGGPGGGRGAGHRDHRDRRGGRDPVGARPASPR